MDATDEVSQTIYVHRLGDLEAAALRIQPLSQARPELLPGSPPESPRLILGLQIQTRRLQAMLGAIIADAAIQADHLPLRNPQ